jgi:hypothetical protein
MPEKTATNEKLQRAVAEMLDSQEIEPGPYSLNMPGRLTLGDYYRVTSITVNEDEQVATLTKVDPPSR